MLFNLHYIYLIQIRYLKNFIHYYFFNECFKISDELIHENLFKFNLLPMYMYDEYVVETRQVP